MSAKLFGCLTLVALTALALAQAGCGGGGPKTAVVRGKVTYRTKAVPNGTITFVPKVGTAATGEIQPDGTYRLTTAGSGDGAVLGAHQVVIVAIQDQSGRLPEDRTPIPPPIVPLKYTSIGTTDLTAEVKDQENVIDFELKDDPKK